MITRRDLLKDAAGGLLAGALPLGRAGTKRNTGACRELSAISITSIFSICLSRLWACLALVALAPKRSTKARFSAMIFSWRSFWASMRSRTRRFSTSKAE